MFPNVRAEMTRINCTLEQLANKIGKTVSTTSQKLSGKSPITLDEAFAIKDALKTDLSIEALFKKDAA